MLSVLLLIGAGLFIRSLQNLHLTDLGMRADNLLAFNIDPSIGGYSPERTQQFYQQLLDRMKTQAGVSGVAFASMGVLEGNEWDSTITVEGYEAKPGENMNPYCNAVSPGYFKTMGVPFIAGRDFEAARRRGHTPPDPKPQGPIDIQSGDRQRELCEALLRQREPDWPAHRLRRRSRHAHAHRNHRRRQRREIHRRAR